MIARAGCMNRLIVVPTSQALVIKTGADTLQKLPKFVLAHPNDFGNR